MNKIKDSLLKTFATRRKLIVGILGLFVSLCIGVCIIFLAFGVDQYIYKSDLSGKVLSQEGKPMEGVLVEVQGQAEISDTSGHYYFEDLRYGVFDLMATKNGYINYKEKLKIKRVSTKHDLVLEFQEFGEYTLRMEGEGLKRDQLIVTINNQLFSIQSDNQGIYVNTGRLLVGNYKLNISSPDIKDIEERLEVTAGKAEKIIKLIPAADVVTEVRDHLREVALSPDEVTVRKNGVIQEKKYITENRFEAYNLDIGEDFEINFKKDGYLEKNIKLNPLQGINSLDITYLVENKRYLITQDGNVLSTFSDGSGVVDLYSSEGSCVLGGFKDKISWASCNGRVLMFELQEQDYKLIREFNGVGNIYDVLYGTKKVVTVEEDRKTISEFAGGQSHLRIYEHSEEIISLLSDWSENIYFTDGMALYKLDRGENKAVEIIKGKYFLSDFSKERGAILLTSMDKSASNNIWEITLKNPLPKKLSFLPSNYAKVRYYLGNQILFQKDSELYLASLDSIINSEFGANVDDYYKINSEGVVLTLLNGRYFIYSGAKGKGKVIDVP